MASLMNYVSRSLRKLADFQINHLFILSFIVFLFTAFSFVGLFSITLQSDLSELDPQDIPVTMLRNEINTDFNRFESVVVLIELDDNVESDLYDIRDPRVINFVKDLDSRFREENTIQAVTSISLFFPGEVPPSLDGVRDYLREVPASDGFFDSGYEWTGVFIEADVGGDNQKISDLNDKINEILESTTKPGGIRTTTTGDAPLNSAIFTFLINDAIYTLILSSALILILIFILERSIKKAVIIMSPLLVGLIWTMGTMGWLGIPITIATAAMGAMLLGLGVEYSIFLFSRFKEERLTKDLSHALSEAISSVGATLVTSGTTTLIGFFALGLSVFPVLSDLGLTLGLGIGFMLLATIVVLPIFMIVDERIEHMFKSEKEIVAEEKIGNRISLDNFYKIIAKFISSKPWTVLIGSIVITIIMFYGMQQIVNQDVDFETILPDDLEAILAYIKFTDEFGDDSSVLIHIEVDPQFSGSDEPNDIRDERVIRYVDQLTEKSKLLDNFISVNSVSQIVKEANGGVIPETLSGEREVFEVALAQNLINSDYSSTLVRISLNEDAAEHDLETVRQIRELVSGTVQPAGINVRPSGGLIVQSELDALNGPDSARTSLIALAGVVIFLYIFTRSFKSTFLPLLTVVLSIFWILGLTGFFRVPFNNITQSVLTMIIGIGIDFGLQVVNRFNQEVETYEKRKAMERTIAGILSPMVITVVAALIGFRAMGLGQLKVMGDLGTLMSFGIASSMVVAITFVASVTLLLYRGKKK